MKSIRRHLVLRLLIGMVVLLGLTSVALYWYSRAFLIAEFDAGLRSKALALVTLTEERAGKIELNFADEFMPEFERGERPDYFQVWLAGGKTLERSRSLKGADLPRRTGTVVHPVYWDLQLPDGREGRAVGIQFAAQRGDRPAGVTYSSAAGSGADVTVVVAHGRAGLAHTLAVFLIALKLFGLVLLAAIAGLVMIVVPRGLASLGALGERAALINASSLQERFDTDGMPQELRPICGRLNDLLARLEDAFQRERRISADIAHELRTPLAELRTLTEVALKWPEDEKGTTAAFENVLAIVAKMESMMTALLALARSEEGKVPVRHEPVNVAKLVADTWSPLDKAAKLKRLDFSVKIAPTLNLHSDPTLLRHVLSNLFSNAVEYAPPGGSLRIEATSGGADFQLSVQNSTDHLQPHDLPHLFERFWRKDAARTSVGHGGLGLTVAQSIAGVLGMDLTAEMPASQTLRILLRGPLRHL